MKIGQDNKQGLTVHVILCDKCKKEIEFDLVDTKDSGATDERFIELHCIPCDHKI